MSDSEAKNKLQEANRRDLHAASSTLHQEGIRSVHSNATGVGRRKNSVFAKFGSVFIFGSVLMLAACGGDSDNKDTTNGNGGNGSAEVGKEEFGMTEEELVTAIEDVESSIAACMSDAGFDYTPIDPVTFREGMSSLAAVPGLSDTEFVERYGYGFSTLPPTQVFRFGEENQAIYDSLSPEDQVAYDRTIVGEKTENTYVLMLENEDFEGSGGCTKTAIEEVFSEEQLNPNFENPFDVLVETDPRYIAAVEEWAGCMSEAGYDYEAPEDAEDELLERLDDLTKGADPTTLSEGELDQLAELQAEERAIAVADLGCQEEHLVEVEEQVERDISGRN